MATSPIRFLCPKCSHTLIAAAHLAGHQAKCKCGLAVLVPGTKTIERDTALDPIPSAGIIAPPHVLPMSVALAEPLPVRSVRLPRWRLAATVGSVFVCLAGLALWLTAGKPERQRGSDVNFWRIVGHKFWRVEMRAEDVERILVLIEGQKIDGVVWIDDRGRAEVMEERQRVFFDTQRDLRLSVKDTAPQGMSERRFYFALFWYKAMPERRVLVAKLLEKLDEADFRQ